MALSRKVRSVRKSVQQPGWLVFEGSFAARPCTVLEMSDTGARILANDAGAIPAKIKLSFSRDVTRGRPCEVVWQRGRTVSVRFV